MPGFGYGFGFRSAERRKGGGTPPPPPPAAIPTLEPGAMWDGSAASGFATTPTDPVRTTAKPSMRLMVPPDQVILDELIVGVLAGANDNGSLFSNMGLSHVRVHFEGAQYEIAAPSYAVITDANGNDRSYYGWWIKLKKPAGPTGEAQVYFEAVPSDASMQARVIGPYSFHLRDTAHDFSIEVAASQPVIVGQRYQDMSAAMSYLRQQSANHPLITITEAGDYVLGGAGAVYGGLGYCTVEATVPIRIVHSETTGSFVAMRPGYNGLHFRGSNVTIDFSLAHALYFEPFAPPRQYWLDGCNLTKANGRNTLFRKAVHDAMAYLAGGEPYLTECYATELYRVGHNASLVRGCTIQSSWHDLFNGGKCIVHNEILDHDTNWYRSDHLAMSMVYNGPASSATIESSGYRTFTAKENGVEVGSFTVGYHYNNWLAGTHFNVSNVVDWINNDLPSGWSATLIDDGHRASQLSTAGKLGFAMSTPVDVKSNSLDLYCSWDLHADIYQKQNTADYEENLLFAFNRGIGLNAQDVFLAGTPGIRDMLVFNNAFANDEPVPDRSQLFANHSHVVIAHNSHSTQGYWIRNDSNYTADGYCLFANNVTPELSLKGGASTALTFAGNHVQALDANTPSGTTSGGNKNNLFANEATGNFSPKGALLSNLKPAVIETDMLGSLRTASAPAGAVA